ncbi:hypothetical protein Q7P37_004423 [Cladosporium fusiforme]
MPPAKTIKQAKAAFKARDETPITEREQKQLERSLQLDRRAWALREREKNRAETAKKRLAQEKAQKDEERRLGTQVRRDRFGFKSSQFHLGAFFQKPGLPASKTGGQEDRHAAVMMEETEAVQQSQDRKDTICAAQDSIGKDNDSDEFDDEFEDVDDESLLEALQSPETARTSKPEAQHRMKPINPAMSMPPPPRPISTASTIKPPLAPPSNPPEIDSEWDDFLESSTQIARELDTQPPKPPNLHAPCTPTPQTPPPMAKEAPRTGSFSSGSFDLTEDDIEKLDPTPNVALAKRNEERMKMPPPPLPLGRKLGPQQREPSEGLGRSDAPLKIIDAKRRDAEEEDEFTMTQLESFVDDDLELTQSR